MKFKRGRRILATGHILGLAPLGVIISLSIQPCSAQFHEHIRSFITMYCISVFGIILAIYTPLRLGYNRIIQISESGIAVYTSKNEEIVNMPWSEIVRIRKTDVFRGSIYMYVTDSKDNLVSFEWTKEREQYILQFYPDIQEKNSGDVMSENYKKNCLDYKPESNYKKKQDK